jgi:hypothetical protein
MGGHETLSRRFDRINSKHSMSKKTSISKQRGQRTGASNGVNKSPVEPLGAFDALLPACEGQLANDQSSPAVALIGIESLATGDQPGDTMQSATERSGELSVTGNHDCEGGRTVSEYAELIDSLRCWQAELQQIDVDLTRRAEDLAARRRAFSRELRTLRREAKLARTPDVPNASEVLGADRGEIDCLRSQIESLVEQNSQLATELAHWAVQRTVDQSSDATASMSWEERRELLYRQFESEDSGVPFSPTSLTSEQCSRLSHEMACMQQELRSKDQEVAELRALLEQRPIVQDTELAVGATAVTRLFDDDELIQEERQRLKEIQAEWEAKFRDMEIAASLERASLARERRQLECKNAELEEQIAHMMQEIRQESITGPAQNRRWFAKLGLGD